MMMAKTKMAVNVMKNIAPPKNMIPIQSIIFSMFICVSMKNEFIFSF